MQSTGIKELQDNIWRLEKIYLQQILYEIEMWSNDQSANALTRNNRRERDA